MQLKHGYSSCDLFRFYFVRQLTLSQILVIYVSKILYVVYSFVAERIVVGHRWRNFCIAISFHKNLLNTRVDIESKLE